MKILQKAQLFIPKQAYSDTQWKVSKYCIVQKYQDYYGIYNSLVESFVTLTSDEYKNILNPTKLNYLIENWFIVPKYFDSEYNLAKIVREKNTKKVVNKYEKVRSFIILPTSMCNARCWYCFENGQHRKHMSGQTAMDVADFMIKKAQGEEINLRWFGGEPLYNESAIDIIINRLKEKGVSYKSSMISNGLLFSKDKLQKYINDWKLQKVQITLDGVGEDYNNTKMYSKSIENPFEIVTGNIDWLSENGIKIGIRMNYSLDSTKQLEDIIQYYEERWLNNKNVSLYVGPVYQVRSNPETSKQCYELSENLDQKYKKYILYIGETSTKLGIKNSHCMLDSGTNIVINPDGKLGGCEHYIDSNFFGTIYDETYDEEVLKKYLERVEEFPVCKDCKLFPMCHNVKMCSNNFCDEWVRTMHEQSIKRVVRNKLVKFVKKLQS